MIIFKILVAGQISSFHDSIKKQAKMEDKNLTWPLIKQL